jgi:hypothetical protein
MCTWEAYCLSGSFPEVKGRSVWFGFSLKVSENFELNLCDKKMFLIQFIYISDG